MTDSVLASAIAEADALIAATCVDCGRSESNLSTMGRCLDCISAASNAYAEQIAETVQERKALVAEERAESIVDRLRAALVDSGGLDSFPAPEVVINGLLYGNSVVWVIGKAGDGKSFVALDMAGCVGTGTPWQEHGVIAGRVLYLVAEGVTGIRDRARAWEESYGQKMKRVVFLPAAVQAAKPGDWNALIQIATEIKPALIVLDTQARITVGMEENSARDMGVFVDQLERLRIATRACVAVVHHKGRNGEHLRGSTALDGAADTILEVSKADDLITIKNTKMKNLEAHEDITLRLTPIDASAVLVLADGRSATSATSATRMAAKWWDLFRDEQVTATKLIDSEVATKPTFYRNVRALLDNGTATSDKVGRNTYYQLARNPSGSET